MARWLLAVPPAAAVAAMPELRRALLAAGNPLSPAFWASAERILAGIAAGEAAPGEVRRWLHATGSEPIDLVAGGFLWPEEGERGPVAVQLHAMLVSHLEELVAAGAIDPNRLCADDPEAWAAYERLQVEWLRTPLPDGREPLWAVSDEEDEEFLALWDEAEADAGAVLGELLADAQPRPRPEADLRLACQRLRVGLRGGEWPYDLLRAAGGVDPDALPSDDAELWLTLAAGVVTCQDEPPRDLGDHAHASWMALAHPDWIGAVVTLARDGPGAPADADSLARYPATFDFEETDATDAGDIDGWDDDDPWAACDEVSPADQELALAVGFGTVELLWSALGAVDADERLTPLGWWGLPEALLRAWSQAD